MKNLLTLLTTLFMLSFIGCGTFADDDVNPNDKPSTEQPGDGDENENPDEGETPNPDTPTQYKIYVYNVAGWEPLNIYMWRWDDEDLTEYVGAWSGAQVEETEVINGFTYYVYDLPTEANGKEIGVIFNNGSGLQTPDWFITVDKDYYVLLSGTTTPTIIEDKNNPIPDNPDDGNDNPDDGNDDVVNPDDYPETHKIYYTSTDGFLISVDCNSFGDARIISNTYDNGLGVIICDRDITSIINRAYASSTKLKSITIPDSVTSIGEAAFRDCSNLLHVTIGSSVTSIGEDAFSRCSNLTSVNIPDSVTTIGTTAFGYCESLPNITIPNSVTSIGDYAFEGCTNLTTVTITEGVSSIGNGMFNGCSSLVSVTIPDSVTTIGAAAFSGCTDLASVIIGNGVTSIKNHAFAHCSSLASITIPNSVTWIEGRAFKECESLKNVTIGANEAGDKLFEGCTIDEIVINGKFIESYEVMIGDGWHYGATFKNIVIGDNITKIGVRAFSGCTSLTTITIPDNVTSIETEAFHNCVNLLNVTIGDGVTLIGDYAFSWSSNLTSVIIGSGVTSIGRNAFDSEHLKEIYCKAATPPTIFYGRELIGSSSVYTDISSFPFNSGMTIYVPKESYDIYTYIPYTSENLWLHYEEYIKPYNFE